MECLLLQAKTDAIESDLEAIVTAWVNSELAAEKFKQNTINRKFFARHFGIRVIGHLLNVIKGTVKPGQCPVMTVMLVFFKEKQIPLSDIFIICSSLRERLVEYFMERGELSQGLYRELSFLIDRNFEGVIREYFDICIYPHALSQTPEESQGAAARIERPVKAGEGTRISAKEFLENNAVQQDDIDELSDLVQDVETLLFDRETLDAESFETLKTLFEKYTYIVDGFYEFQELGYSLSVLVGLLSSIRFGDIAPEDHKKVLAFFDSISSDLNSWRKNIFVEQSAIDINYLDDSLLSSIAMFEVLLTSRDNSGDEGDLELF